MDTKVGGFAGRLAGLCLAGRTHASGALAVWVCALASAAAGQEARGLKPRPPWNVEEAPGRLVVEKGQDDFFLTRVPAWVGDGPVAAVRVFIATNEAAARVVWTDADSVTLLVDARGAKRGQPVKIYPVPGGAPVAVEAGPSAVADPAPLRGRARRTAGMDFPKSLEEAAMLETRCDGKAAWFAVRDAGGLPETFGDWFRGDWTRKSHLVDLQTWLVVPEDGRYLFGLAGVAPAWLLVDGRPVLEHPAGRPYDKWTSGPEVALAAGLRRIQVRTVVRREIDTGLAWKRSGEPGAATNMVALTGGDFCAGRWEERGRRVQPFATAACGGAYRFAGAEEVFVPFTLTDGSACWGTNHVARWRVAVGGQPPVADGRTAEVVVRRSRLPAEAVLTAVAATGEEAAYAFGLAYDGPVWSEFEVSSRVAGVPAACYGDDRVRPVIHIRTSAPDGLAYELAWEVERASGERAGRVEALAAEMGWARVGLDEMEAGAVSRLSWSLRHQGVELSRGAARFLREPFGTLPDAVSGELLKAGGEFVVLVASKASRREPRAAVAAEGAGGVVLLDGLGLAAGGGGAAWRAVDVQALEQDEAASGMPLLLPLAALKGAMPASAAVLAPSMLGISREGGTAGFERRLAAMTGLLAGPASGSPRVLLVVPPAFDVLPGCGCAAGAVPCVHAARAREYAEIAVRVADAHGVETVDVFSAFQTAVSGGPLVKDGRFTAEGAAFAQRLIEKKLGR